MVVMFTFIMERLSKVSDVNRPFVIVAAIGVTALVTGGGINLLFSDR